MRIEIWKMIPGFEGLYMVSNLGRVKSLDYRHTGKEHLLKGNVIARGHIQYTLYKGEKRICILAHRAVALAFIQIPDKYKGIPIEKLDVHHINFIPDDNRVENLVWLTKREHLKLHKNTKVYQYGLDGIFIAEWCSIDEAEKSLNIRGISRCCRSLQGSAGDFQWRYYKVNRIPKVKSRYEKIADSLSKPVVLFTIDGKKNSEHNSVNEAAAYLGVVATCVTDCCKGRQNTVGGYIARYI